MSRIVHKGMLVALLALSLFVVGCARKVDVKTGTRVMCSYGHVISDDTKTVKVSAKEASKLRVKTEVRTCDKHTQAQGLYEDAQKAIKAGDLVAAKKILEKVAALYPDYGDTAKQLADIAAKKKPKPDAGGAPDTGGDTTQNPGDGDTSVPSGKLTVWTPDTITGYKASKPKIDVFTVSRDYVPEDSSIVLCVIVAEQQRTADGAKLLLGKMVKGPCPNNADTLTINGRKVYFGTDGRRLATIGFTEGPVMVAMQMASAAEGSPKSMKAALIAAVEQLP